MPNEEDTGVAASPPGHQPSASAVPASQSGVPNAALRQQVTLQCKAVRDLAEALSKIYSDKMWLVVNGHCDAIIGLIGPWSASHMETLGDILNGMDAVSDDDAWMDPVFAEAHRLWPDASGIEAATADETRSGSAEGESPVGEAETPQTPQQDS